MNRLLSSCISLLAAFTLLLTIIPNAVHAGGPIQANGTTAIIYPPQRLPLRCAVDLGKLGVLSEEQARGVVAFGIAEWNSVETATISLEALQFLDRDVVSPLDPYIASFNQFSDGVFPIVFDDDGSITDDRMGVGAGDHIFGFAGSYTDDGFFYQEGFVVLNGRTTSTRSDPEGIYREVTTHELGHMIGLGHSQSSIGAIFPIMYPTVQELPTIGLQADDITAVSFLYPIDGYLQTTGTISGSVFDVAGNPMSGVNVVAVDSATRRAYSTTSDYYSGGSFNFQNPPARTGAYQLKGLPPGTYYVRVEPIHEKHRNGSSVASYRTPLNTNIWREWYNGGDESGEMYSDNSNQKTRVVVLAGQQTTDVRIVVNAQSELEMLVEHNVEIGTNSITLDLPTFRSSGKRLTRFATRYRAPFDGSVLGLSVWLYSQSILPQGDTLLVAVHPNIPGSLRGIPGEPSKTVRIPLADLSVDQENDIWLREIGDALNFNSGEQFHVSMQVIGSGEGRLRTVFDYGVGTQNQTSHYREGLGQWFNFPDGLEGEGNVPGWNIWMNLLYAPDQVSSVDANDNKHTEEIRLSIESVLPNPATEHVVIEYHVDGLQTGVSQLFIVNTRGEVLTEKNLPCVASNNCRVTVNIADWPSGMYYAVLRSSGSERIHKFRVVR